MLENVKALKRYVLSAPDRVNALRVNTAETVVINGFWRSGTTWLQELVAEGLNAKRVFEPLQARCGYIQKAVQGIALPDPGYAYINGFMPYATTAHTPSPAMKALLHQAQKGILTNPFVLRDQALLDPGRAFKNRVVVKYVKGALSLKYLKDTYQCPVIHIYRDPRAVISSIKARKNWAEGAFEDFSLTNHLLNVNDGRADYFSRYSDDIRAIDKAGDFERLTGYYFLTEKFIEDSFGGDSLHYVRFEELARNPDLEFQKIAGYLNCDDIKVPDFKKPSSTAYVPDSTKKMETSKVTSGWAGKLGEAQLQTIEDIAARFAMTPRLTGLAGEKNTSEQSTREYAESK